MSRWRSLRRAPTTHPLADRLKVAASSQDGLACYCHCGNNVALDADRWPDEMRLPDLDPRFVYGRDYRGADVRLD